MIKWKATKKERLIIRAIANRAEKMFGFAIQDTMMDVEATHCNGCPLKLEKLLAFPDFDFSHDIGGIRRCLNRTTGALENCFLPRCAAPAREEAQASML